MRDVRAEDLRRGQRIHIGGKGWRSITYVRKREREHWIGEGPGPAIEIRWRGGMCHVKPDSMILVEQP